LPYFLFFPLVKQTCNFIRFVDFTRIAALNTASDDVTNQITHRIFNTDSLSSFVYFIVKTGNKFSRIGGL